MKKKVFMMLPCIAAFAIATFVGKKNYELKDYVRNPLLVQNVEALTSGGDLDMGDDNSHHFEILASGKCGYKYQKCDVTYEIDGASVSATLGLKDGKVITLAGVEVNYPNLKIHKICSEVFRKETGTYRVCADSMNPLHTYDRCKQKLCDNTRDCNNQLARPDDALI